MAKTPLCHWPACVGAFSMVLALSLLGCEGDRRDKERATERRVEKRLDRKVKQEVDRQVMAALARQPAAPRGGASGAGQSPRPGEARRGAGPDAARTGPGARGAGRPDAAVPAGGADAGGAVATPNGPPPRAVADEQGLGIARVVVAARVVSRKPEGIARVFTLDAERVYCFVDARNPKGPERMLQVTWRHDGKVFHTVRLRVGRGYIWRTWAYLRLRPAHVGAWRCTVRNESGDVLGSADFQVVRSAPGADRRRSVGPSPSAAAPPRRAVPSARKTK